MVICFTFVVVFSAQSILPSDSLNPSDGEEAGTTSEPHACKHQAAMLLAKHEGSDIKKRFDNRINHHEYS